MSKVISRVCGGIGNQLFCYAAARRLALTTGAELVIDDVSGFVRDFRYKRHFQLGHFCIPCRKAKSYETLEPFSRYRSCLKRTINGVLPYAKRHYIAEERLDFDARLLTLKPKSTVYLHGYWQSEDYFKDVAGTIREDLKIVPPSDTINLKMAEQINHATAVAVHVRYHDSPGERGNNNAPDDYYKRAVARMDRLVPNAHFYVFSDHPQNAIQNIPFPKERYTCISHNKGDVNAYADLWLMTRCRHFVIANSTFSWWGAWLAPNRDKKIIAPGFERSGGKMAWGFKGLLPEEWIRL